MAAEGWRQRLVRAGYRVLWYPALPFVLGYFWLRGRGDPDYRRHMAERFGGGDAFAATVWVHAVSLGELRSAVPLIRAMLDRGETVLTTHLTPAGRRASEKAFVGEIAEGRVAVRYMPLEFGWAWRRFWRRYSPRLGLSMEIEIWPVMIAEALKAGVPLWLANSQVPEKSFARAIRWAPRIGHPVAGVAGVLAKSQRMAERFRALGAPNVHVTGELRFDQPIDARLLAAGAALLTTDEGGAIKARGVVALASVVEGEDDQYLAAYREVQAACRAQSKPAPLFIHIPRAPERFGEVGDMLAREGQRVIRRSGVLDADLHLTGSIREADVLLGDSMGEMYFYLSLADMVVVGGGFVPKGAHNVIEPLALKKPVLVGPHVWTIEYPGQEAAAAGVLQICPSIPALSGAILALLDGHERLDELERAAEVFFADHAGATERSMAVLGPILDGRRPQ